MNLEEAAPEENIGVAFMRLADEVGGIELEIPPRTDPARFVDFSEIL